MSTAPLPNPKLTLRTERHGLSLPATFCKYRATRACTQSGISDTRQETCVGQPLPVQLKSTQRGPTSPTLPKGRTKTIRPQEEVGTACCVCVAQSPSQAAGHKCHGSRSRHGKTPAALWASSSQHSHANSPPQWRRVPSSLQGLGAPSLHVFSPAPSLTSRGNVLHFGNPDIASSGSR